MTGLILPIGTALTVTALYSFIFRNADKVDKGFTFNYFKLSYRRKMKRTWIDVPLIILLLLFVNIYTDWSAWTKIWLGLFLLVGTVIQFLYNYSKWNKTEA